MIHIFIYDIILYFSLKFYNFMFEEVEVYIIV